MAGLVPWVRLARPGNSAISLVGTVVGGLSVVGLHAPDLITLLALLLVAGLVPFLVTSAGNALNDFLDVEGDRINHPERPIPSGDISPDGARRFSIVLFALSGVPLAVLPAVGLLSGGAVWEDLLEMMAIWIASIILLVNYETRTKAQGITGNVTVAFLTGAVFLFGGAAVGHPLPTLPWLLMAFFATLSREVIKDMEDLEGDKDRQTLPKTAGIPVATATARASVAIAILLSALPLLTWLSPTSLAGMAYLALVAVSDLTFLLSILWLPRRLHGEQGLSKAAMVLALGAFLGASLH